MPPRKLKGAAKASYKRRASSRTPKPPSRLLEDAASPPPTNTVRREKRPKTVIELEDEDAPVDTISRFDDFQVFVLVTRQKNHRYPQAHWTVNPVKSWADQEQLLIDVALEELRHDHMVVEGVNKYSLKPNISWKVCRGRSRDAPWCRLRTEDDWEGFIDAVHTERNTPKVEWSAFILIETHYDPTRAASQFEFDQQTPLHPSQTQSRARKPLIPRPRHSATNTALQGISNELANDPQRYKRILAVQTLQAKHKCAKHHQQYCYVHPFSGYHRYISNDLLNLWSKYLVAKEHGVTVEDPPIHDPLFAELLKPYKSTDQSETPESRHSSSGMPQLPTPVTAPRFDLLPLPPSSQPTPTPTPTTIDTQMLRGSSPLQGPAADDLDGFLAYVKTKVPEYIDFDCQTVRDAIIDNGVVLDDLKNIDPNGLPPVKHGWVRIMRKWWPVWKGIQREQQSKPRGPLGLKETPSEVYESQEFDESFDL
ncbi:hypothetical protein G7K_4962-t1 [Saitoella complicata NRRL Y-17804]|uniref:Uncharacterized protein n=2 Tax=Saitoella complicata (strain BCRC 22490 / CBS 7301 / JCM 7358 / NBRC 10748 / NRRL Y-17804) TaxID=698492 RepID=A0A0E9NLS8_SAICN|nr:hypothetical protein G7K_2888-t1 [Saitoella complicata NRRL Y-17804]GAO50842.1 hypothetical protein G7K_4962-t1 [Saitoella complicata NRRL Y-17804]